MVSFWRNSNSKHTPSTSNNSLKNHQNSETLRLKDVTVNFSMKNGHQNNVEPCPSKKFGLPKFRTFESTVQDFKNIETAKSHLKLTLKKHSTILFILGVFAAITAIIDTQITTWKRQTIVQLSNTSKNSTEKDLNKLDLYTGIQVSARSIISILSCSTVIYLYIFYTHLHTLSVLRNIYLRGFSFWLTPLALKFFIECVVCLVHVPPGIDIFPEEAQLIVFSRLYLVGRFLRQKHKLVNSKSTRFLASVTKTELTSIFLLKTYFMRRPFLLIISFYLITVILGGYGVYLVEQHNSYSDTIWMLVVTMTTVGFGDFVPKSAIARTFVAIIAVIGIFLMALCISLVHESLQLTQQEKRILAYVESTEKSRELKEVAATAIQCWWRYWQLMTKRDLRGRRVGHWVKVTAMRSKLYTVIVKWRSIKIPQEDHWKKEFLGDNTAMMLTDVSREVVIIRDFLQDFVKPILEPLQVKKDDTTDDVTKLDPECSRKTRPPTQQDMGNRAVIHRHSAPEHSTQTIKETCFNTDGEVGYDPDDHQLDTEPLIGHRYSNSRTSLTNKSMHDMIRRPSMPSSTRTEFHGYGSRPSSNFENRKENDAIQLLQNQIQIMRGNLDDMYIKSRQDLRDLENVVSCFASGQQIASPDTPFCLNCRILSQMRSSSC